MMSKKLKTGIVAVSLIAALGIGGTLAFLSASTQEKENVFTMGEGITGELKEPTWDNDNFTADALKVAVDTSKLGKNSATKFTPGRVILKDPAVANTSEETPAYVGITIAYGGVSTWQALNEFADVDWNTTDWTFNDDYTRAILKEDLAAGEKTPTLFNKVTIKDSAVADEDKADETHPLMQNFEITLNGYLVQSENSKTPANALHVEFPDYF